MKDVLSGSYRVEKYCEGVDEMKNHVTKCVSRRQKK